jgi:hypothetical protein
MENLPALGTGRLVFPRVPDDSSNAPEDPIHRNKRLSQRQCTHRSRLAYVCCLPWEAKGGFFPGYPLSLSSHGLRGENVYVSTRAAEEPCSCEGRRGASLPELCLWFVVPVLGLSVWRPAGPPLLGSVSPVVSLPPLDVLARPVQGAGVLLGGYDGILPQPHPVPQPIAPHAMHRTASLWGRDRDRRLQKQ